MKRILTFLIMAAAALTMISCNPSKTRKALLPNISGKAGEVIVVINKGDWEGAVGTTLRDTLAKDCPFLPQKEPLYTLVNVIPSGFTNMFQIHRNIVIVRIGNDVVEPGVNIRYDVWARPQCVITINAIDSDSAVQLIKENSKRIITSLEQIERDRIIANSKKYEERSIAPAVTEMIGGSPHFPSGYKLKKRTSDFIWIEYAIQDVTPGILAYKYPVVEGEQMMSLESIIENSNEMLKNNVPGMFENTYMTIASGITPSVKYLNYKGHAFAEVRGLWDVHNDYMGGPFVSYTTINDATNEVFTIDCYVHSPKYGKRNFLRPLEHLVYLISFPKSVEQAK